MSGSCLFSFDVPDGETDIDPFLEPKQDELEKQLDLIGASEIQRRIARRIADVSGVARAITAARNWAGQSMGVPDAPADPGDADAREHSDPIPLPPWWFD